MTDENVTETEIDVVDTDLETGAEETVEVVEVAAEPAKPR